MIIFLYQNSVFTESQLGCYLYQALFAPSGDRTLNVNILSTEAIAQSSPASLSAFGEWALHKFAASSITPLAA